MEYFSAELDNGAYFEGKSLADVQQKVVDYYIDRPIPPDFKSIERHHGEDEVEEFDDEAVASACIDMSELFDETKKACAETAAYERDTRATYYAGQL